MSTTGVTEQQKPTYINPDEQVEIATSTQPATDVASPVEVEQSPKNEEEEYFPLNTYTYEQEEVVEEILKIFPDAPIMVEVARCESNLNPNADRKGIDGGLFQINQVHLSRLATLGLDRYDLHDNIAYARMLYDESGLKPWYMSKHCWG